MQRLSQYIINGNQGCWKHCTHGYLQDVDKPAQLFQARYVVGRVVGRWSKMAKYISAQLHHGSEAHPLCISGKWGPSCLGSAPYIFTCLNLYGQ